MSEMGHDLHSEFPNDGAVLHELKLSCTQFKTLSARYHLLNKDIVRIETGLEGASDFRLEDMKKERLAMLDTVAGMIAGQRRPIQAA